MNLKKINKVLFYTLLIFAMLVYSVYPTSGAKYIKEKDTILIYAFDIEQLYAGDFSSIIWQEMTTTYEHLDLAFYFDRSEDADVEYRIDVGKCSVTKVETEGVVSNNNKTIKYSSEGEDRITVHYSCAIEDILGTDSSGNEILQSYPKVYETLDNQEYLYTAGTYIIKKSDFDQNNPKPDEGIVSEYARLVLPNDVSDKYNQVLSWIKARDYQGDVLTYFQSKYNEDNITIDQELVGLTITYDEANDSYIYELDDNFIGYARTATSTSPNTMYFSTSIITDNETKINSIFEYYVNTYLYPDSPESAEIVINYVNKNGGVYSVLAKENEITGISLPSAGDVIGVSKNILTIIAAIESSPMEIPYGSSTMMLFYVRTGLMETEFVNNDQDKYLTIVTDNPDTYDLRDAFVRTYEAFDEYHLFVHDDFENPILFHVYSPYVEGDEATYYNYISAVELKDEASIVLEIDDLDKFKTTFDSIYALFGYTADYSAFDITTGGDIVLTSTTDATDVRTVKVEINENKKVFTLDIE